MNLDNLKVSLVCDHSFFWKYFNDNFDHHMKIGKLPWRVYPFLNYRIEGLEPENKYSISLHFEEIIRSFDVVAGERWPVRKATNPSKKVKEERGVLSGVEWMKGGIFFRSVRITDNLETESESVIFLRLGRKYSPVVSIQEDPTPGNPNPPVIECRLDYTEFTTVGQIQDEELRSLKLVNRQGHDNRWFLRKKAKQAPPIFATCTIKNQPVVSTAESTASTFFKNLPANIERELLEASNIKTGKSPKALTEGFSFLEEAEKDFKSKQVTQANFLQSVQNGTIIEVKEEMARFPGYNTTQPAFVPNGFLAQTMPQFQLSANQHNFPPQIFSSTLYQSIPQQTPQNHSSPQAFPSTVPCNNGAPLFHQTAVQPTLPYLTTMTGHVIANFGNFIPHSAIVGPNFTYPAMPAQNVHPTTQPRPFGQFLYPFNTNHPPVFSHNFMSSQK
ncbi:hypothetical protein CAEBREN_25928 [Caenorhabditis brenneri]|uniref:T-box domain-containing protein n=1 Tax=Caenorhabditis brenneri TaxID=135651 RepID=G0MBC8_CAEBE|nr:hypothetical protein CAEBREN_25928 [Caenorhabditis brenneri]